MATLKDTFAEVHLSSPSHFEFWCRNRHDEFHSNFNRLYFTPFELYSLPLHSEIRWEELGRRQPPSHLSLWISSPNRSQLIVFQLYLIIPCSFLFVSSYAREGGGNRFIVGIQLPSPIANFEPNLSSIDWDSIVPNCIPTILYRIPLRSDSSDSVPHPNRHFKPRSSSIDWISFVPYCTSLIFNRTLLLTWIQRCASERSLCGRNASGRAVFLVLLSFEPEK